jgi:hypothetical protein
MYVTITNVFYRDFIRVHTPACFLTHNVDGVLIMSVRGRIDVRIHTAVGTCTPAAALACTYHGPRSSSSCADILASLARTRVHRRPRVYVCTDTCLHCSSGRKQRRCRGAGIGRCQCGWKGVQLGQYLLKSRFPQHKNNA